MNFMTIFTNILVECNLLTRNNFHNPRADIGEHVDSVTC